jgi:hypothetical protein
MSIPELDVLHANRIKDLEAQLREKDAEIERLRADSDRLDWLESECFYHSSYSGKYEWRYKEDCTPLGLGVDLRSSIDAARLPSTVLK